MIPPMMPHGPSPGMNTSGTQNLRIPRNFAIHARASLLPFTSRLPAFNFARAAFSGEDRELDFCERRVAFFRRFLPGEPLEEPEARFFRGLRPPLGQAPEPFIPGHQLISGRPHPSV